MEESIQNSETIMKYNIHLKGVPAAQKRVKGIEEIFEKLMTEFFKINDRH